MIRERPAIIRIVERGFLVGHIAKLLRVGELAERSKNTLENLSVFVHDFLKFHPTIVFIRKISEQEQLIRRDPYLRHFMMQSTHDIWATVILFRNVEFQLQCLKGTNFLLFALRFYLCFDCFREIVT